MGNKTQQNEKAGYQSGGPGRTPESAEGDRDTIETDLREKNLDEDSEN